MLYQVKQCQKDILGRGKSKFTVKTPEYNGDKTKTIQHLKLTVNDRILDSIFLNWSNHSVVFFQIPQKTILGILRQN